MVWVFNAVSTNANCQNHQVKIAKLFDFGEEFNFSAYLAACQPRGKWLCNAVLERSLPCTDISEGKKKRGLLRQNYWRVGGALGEKDAAADSFPH